MSKEREPNFYEIVPDVFINPEHITSMQKSHTHMDQKLCSIVLVTFNNGTILQVPDVTPAQLRHRIQAEYRD